MSGAPTVGALRRYAVALLGAAVATAITMLALPGAAGATGSAVSSGSAGGAGYGLHASAEAGSVTAVDPTAIVPYADQIVTKAVADLTGVDAYADGEPVYPGTATSLAPVVLFLAGAPALPVGADVAATAHPPESSHDSVTLGSALAGPLRIDGPGATADAAIADHAVAEAHNAGISGADAAAGAPLTGTHAEVTTRAPKPGRADASAAAAEAEADLGAVKVVATSTVFPAPHAAVTLVEPDGSTVPVDGAGVAVASGVVRATTETAKSSARAGATFEHPGPNGGVVRVTLVSTRAEAVGALVATDVPAVAALGPLSAGTSADDASSATGSGDVSGASFPSSLSAPVGTPGVSLTEGRPVIRAAVRPASFVRRRPWLIGPLFFAWLLVGCAALAAGRRVLAPQVAAHDAEVRAARAAASDHLDRG